jgi:hypothetical protein
MQDNAVFKTANKAYAPHIKAAKCQNPNAAKTDVPKIPKTNKNGMK